VNNQHDIMSVCLAVVRGVLTPEQAREAILSRTTPVPVQETLRLKPELLREAAQLHTLPPGERDECLELFKNLYNQPPGEVVTREDTTAAEILVEQGLISTQQAWECLEVQRDLRSKGIHPLPRLGELLIKKGYLLPTGAGRAELPDPKDAGSTNLVERTRGRASPIPPEVQEALKTPENRFGRYARTTLLGQGGAGEVWKAWDLELERWVALKFLKYENTQELARLKREAQTAASLSHPGIARVYEIAEAQGRMFLALEFIEGQTLETYPRHDHRKLVSLIRDVALAVHYAHGKGTIHRDLKPGNIMVDSESRAYVMDFGLARQIESKKSITGAIMGTPAYMPPEQALGAAVEVRSDVYSLGATLYELLGGKAPFEGSNVFETLEQVVHHEPAPLSNVAADLRTIVFKCLMKDVSARYSTAAEVGEDLRRWMEGEPILAHPPSALYRLRKKAAKWRAVIAVGLAGALAAAAVAGFIIPRWLRADRAESMKELELEAEKAERGRAERALALARPHLDEGRKLSARLDRLLTTDTWTPRDVRSLVDQAEKEFDRALTIYPDHPDALLEKARLFQYENNPAAAIEFCSKAIDATHGYATAYLQRARLRLDQYEDLRLASGRAVGLETEEGRRLADRIRSDLREVQAWSKDARELTFADGALAFVEGKYLKAARELEEYSKLTVSDYRGWVWTAHAWLHVPGMEEKATQSLNEAFKYRPRLASLLIYRGTAQLQESRRLRRGSDAEKAARLRSLAMEDFRAAREIDPSDPGAHSGLGEACLEAGEGSLAAAHFSQALGLNPRYSAALIGRSRARLRDGDPVGALADAEEALRVAGGDPQALIARGRARCAREDLGGALNDLSSALLLDPREPDALVGLGDLKRERGDAVGALEDYGRALAADPASAEAFHHRANARRDLGDLPAALLDLDRALRLDGGNPWILYDRAICACDRCDWTEALTHLRKGLARMPLDPFPFWMTIWVARSRSGESAAAGEELALSSGDFTSANPEKLNTKLVRTALGQIGVLTFKDELERVPRRRDETARGYFYAAERALKDGDRATARDLFGRCLKAKAITAPEDSMAAAELRALDERK
jgi:tetratricopeptide (TPR) repeat protein